MIKTKSLFIVLLVLAFLPLALACGDEQGSLAPMSGNAVSGSSMMYGFSGMGFFGPLIMILIITSLVLIIIWLIKELKNSKKEAKK